MPYVLISGDLVMAGFLRRFGGLATGDDVVYSHVVVNHLRQED